MAITDIKRRSGRENEIISRDVLDYGPIDFSGGADATATLNKAFAHAARMNNVEIALPRGIYKISGPLFWPGPSPRIRGMSDGTVIAADAADYTWLTVGGGAGTGHWGPTGFIRDLKLTCLSETPSPSGFTSGLLMDNAQHIDVSGVTVEYAPIGIDMINNNYGSSFTNVRTGPFDFCRIGLSLRGLTGDFGAGNDIDFINCWIHGRDAAIHEEGANGNYHFFGGQLNAGIGLGAPDDTKGVVTIGPPITGGASMGSAGISLHSVVLEGISNMWGIRGFGVSSDPNGLHISMTGKTSFLAGTNAIGVWKITGGYNDTVEMIGVGVNNAAGTFSSSVPCVYSGNVGARAHIYEVGTYGKPTFNGVARDLADRCMCIRSQLMKASAESWGLMLRNGKIYWSADDGNTYISTDWGVTFPTKLSTQAVP